MDNPNRKRCADNYILYQADYWMWKFSFETVYRFKKFAICCDKILAPIWFRLKFASKF